VVELTEIGSLRISLGLNSIDFTQGMQDVNRRINALNSEFRAVSTGAARFDNRLDALRSQTDVLNRTFQTHQRRVQELRRRYEELRSTRGEDAAETVRMARAYNNAVSAMNRTENQLRSTNRQIQTQSSAWRRLGQALEHNHSQLGMVGMNLQMAGMNIATSLTPAVVALGGGLAATAKQAIDFESQMSSVKSVMSPDEVDKYGKSLEDLAKQLSTDTKYSSIQAAQGMEELIKAGVSVTDIVHGGLKGALALATAGELELGDAAEIASTALNAFKKDNLSVMDAADLLAGSANASATSVSQMKESLAMVSAVAGGVGLSFKDTTTGLAAFAQSGLRGSDAGTSLKTMLLNLTPSSKEAAEQMKELGLLTKKGTSEFYDANGSIKSLADIAEILRTKLAKLNDEQRQSALKEMFGTDAIRAANILYKEGAAGINNMAQAMTKIKAADVAKVKLDNVKGSLEKLKSTVQTAAISFGNTMLPTIEKVSISLQKITNGFNDLSPSTKKFIVGAGVAATAVTGLTVAFGATLSLVGSAIAGFSTISTAVTALAGGTGVLSAAFTALTGPVGLTVAGIGLATVAAVGLTKAFKDNNEVSFKALEARQKEIESNDKLIKNFDTLRIKNQLSNEEMTRFLDIQDELASTSTPERIAALKDEQGKLLEKSGLTNKEMQNFLKYNDEIIKKSPNTEKAISNQGNAYALNTDEIRKANAEKLKGLKIDAEAKMNQVVEREAGVREKIINLQGEINKKDKERQETYNRINEVSSQILKKEKEVKDLTEAHEEALKSKNLDAITKAQDKLSLAKEQLLTLNEQKTAEQANVQSIIREMEAKQESLDLSQKDLKALDAAKYKYEEVVLAQVGMTASRGKGLETLEKEISKLQSAKEELQKLHASGKINTAEYNDQVTAIDEQIGKLGVAKGELENINTIAGKQVYKTVEISDQAKKDAEEINRLLAKKITKDVYINTPKGYGRNVQQYAAGTKYAPGGVALVGEEGPELVYLPKGSQVFTSSETSRMLNSINVASSPSLNNNYLMVSPTVESNKETKNKANKILELFNCVMKNREEYAV
jgi:TP901 family phage tail tape measure protein